MIGRNIGYLPQNVDLRCRTRSVGVVVAPGATEMQIVSRDDGLEVEARVEPQAIDRVAVDQQARCAWSRP